MLKMTTEKLKVLVRLKGRVMFFKTLALKKLVVLALYASDLHIHQKTGITQRRQMTVKDENIRH